jgi:hypothetical protein
MPRRARRPGPAEAADDDHRDVLIARAAERPTETNARWYAKSAPATDVRALDHTNASTL